MIKYSTRCSWHQFTQSSRRELLDYIRVWDTELQQLKQKAVQHTRLYGRIRALPALSLWTFGLSSQHDGAAHASFQGFSSISNAIIVCVCERDTHTYHDRWTALLMHWTSALPHWISKWNWFMMRDDQTRSGQDASGFCASGPPLTFQGFVSHGSSGLSTFDSLRAANVCERNYKKTNTLPVSRS